MHAFSPVIGRQVSEFKVNLVYKASSRHQLGLQGGLVKKGG